MQGICSNLLSYLLDRELGTVCYAGDWIGVGLVQGNIFTLVLSLWPHSIFSEIKNNGSDFIIIGIYSFRNTFIFMHHIPDILF